MMSTRTHGSGKAAKPTPPVGTPATSLVATLRSKFGIPRRTFARLTGFSERVIADWESGKAMSQPSLRRIQEIDRLRDQLAGVVKPEAIPLWLETPNKAFGGLKPLEVIERGEVDRLWQMIFEIESGVAS